MEFLPSHCPPPHLLPLLVLSQGQSPWQIPAFTPGIICARLMGFHGCDLSRPHCSRAGLKGSLRRDLLPDIPDLSPGLSSQTLKTKSPLLMSWSWAGRSTQPCSSWLCSLTPSCVQQGGARSRGWCRSHPCRDGEQGW